MCYIQLDALWCRRCIRLMRIWNMAMEVVLCCVVVVCFVFFFQAEDGIRDLVRSRGLGDVYKRQPDHC